MFIQPTTNRNEAIRLATCEARLRRPISDYDQHTVSELIEHTPSPTLSMRRLHQPINAFQSLNPELMNANEWRFLNSLKTVTIDDNPSKPVIYALIPREIVEKMTDVDFHTLLESLANNEKLKDHVREKCGYDCGLVFFMIDNTNGGNSKQTTEPMGIEFERFSAEPKKEKLIVLGATGANAITPPDIQEFAQAGFANRTCLLATDLRRIVPQAAGKAKFIVTESTPLLSTFPDERAELRRRLNGRAIVDDVMDPKKELKDQLESGAIEFPHSRDPLSNLLVPRTAPSVVEKAGSYIFDSKSKSFIDTRDSDNFELDSDMERQFYQEQLEFRSPYPVRRQSATEKATL